MFRVLFLSLCLCASVARTSWAQQEGFAHGPAPRPPASEAPFDIKAVDPESYRAMAYRITDGRAPRIDGTLDDGVWQLAPVQGNFIQREPHYGRPASEPTEFRVLYDDKMLYVGVWVWDTNPAGIMGSEMKRDSGLSKGDQLKITFDTFHDHRNAFYFSTNPLGAYKDANTVENGRTINYDWNAVWNNRTSRDDKGWYVEIAIPLSQLRFRASVDELLWGMNVCRILLRKNEESYWVPFPREWGASGFARMSNAGVLAGLRSLRTRRRVEFVPFVLPEAQRDYVRGSERAAARFGGDFKLGITNDLTADFTYHTDFAQVEADQEVVNLTRFSLFFPEKRQFFTETAGIFDYGKSVSGLSGEMAANDPGLLALFYSRRVGLVEGQQVPIIGGGRVTGRAGAYTLGVLNITTESSVLRGASGQPPGSGAGQGRPLESANFTAVRVKRDILAKSSVGALFVNSANGISEYNRALGLDAGLVLGQHVTLTSLFATTQAQAGNDRAAVVDVLWKNDRFNYGAQYQDIGAQFNAEMGYIPRIDIRAGRAKAGWTPRPKWGGLRQVHVSGTTEYYENHAGRVESRTHQLEAVLQKQDTSSAKVTVTGEYDNLSSPFATAGTVIPVGAYSWQTTTLQVLVEPHPPCVRHRVNRARRLLQWRPPGGARQPDAAGGEDAALRAQLHAQPRAAAGASALHQQRGELPREPLVLARFLPEGVRPVQRRPQDGELQLPLVVPLQAGQRPLRGLQPGLGHRPAPHLGAGVIVPGAQPLARGEADVLARAVGTVDGSRRDTDGTWSGKSTGEGHGPRRESLPSGSSSRQGSDSVKSRPPAVSDHLDDHRQERHDDDAEGHQREVVLHHRHVAERVARARAHAHPQQRARHVEEHELLRRHLGRAGHKRHEGADDGDEAAGDDGHAAVLLEEGVRLGEVIAVQQPVHQAGLVVGREHARAHEAPHRVVHRVAEDGRGDEQHRYHPDVERPGGRQRAGGEQQRIAGQEGRHDEARLGEDHDKQHAVHPQAVVGDERRQMHIKVEKRDRSGIPLRPRVRPRVPRVRLHGGGDQHLFSQHISDLHGDGGLVFRRREFVSAFHEVGLPLGHVAQDDVEHAAVVGRVDHHRSRPWRASRRCGAAARRPAAGGVRRPRVR